MSKKITPSQVMSFAQSQQDNMNTMKSGDNTIKVGISPLKVSSTFFSVILPLYHEVSCIMKYLKNQRKLSRNDFLENEI